MSRPDARVATNPGLRGDSPLVTWSEDRRTDDMRLVLQARGGDVDAFSELAGAYRAELRAHCYRVVGSGPDAEDALQEGLLRAWRGLGSFEGRGSVRAWLYAIVNNASLDLLKKRTRREQPMAFGPSASPGADLGAPLPGQPLPDPDPEHWSPEDSRRSPEAQYEQRESIELAFLAALNLPPLQRTVLLLREIAELSTAEIASQLGTTAAAVNSALQRARAAVRSGFLSGSQQPTARALGDERTIAMIQRYASAMVRGDLDTLISMLTREVVPCQLPTLDPHFAGRAAELAELDGIVDGSYGTLQPHVVSISGAAGIGKTALAVQWAHRIASRFGDGQLYVNLQGSAWSVDPVTADSVVRSLLDALRVPPGQIPVDAQGQASLYQSLLAERRILIVLDNARDADQVRELLPSGGSCLVVVTSRGRLPSLAADGAHPIWLDVLTKPEARSLLAKRLGSDRVGNGADVDELIELCARLPLALSVIAAQAAEYPGFPLSSIATRLRNEGQRLDGLDTGEPHSGVRSVFWSSYRQLTDPAARLFRLLSVHPGPHVTVPAAASLAGLPESSGRQAVGELTRAGLLAEATPGRFTCHDLLRAYAAELARARDREADRRAALRRILDYYLHASAALVQALDTSREQIDVLPPAEPVPTVPAAAPADALAWFDAELPVLMAAITRAAKQGFSTHAWQLAWAIKYPLSRSGRWQAISSAYRSALTAAARTGDLTGQAHALRGLGGACAELGAIDEGISCLARAVQLFRELNDATAEARAHLDMATVVSMAGRYREALTHAGHARDLFRAAHHKDGQAAALNNMSYFHAQLGNHHNALSGAQLALAAFQQHGDQRCQAIALYTIAVAHHHLRDYHRALGYGYAALSLHRLSQDQPGQAEVLLHLGDTHHQLGDHIGARTCWAQALAALHELNTDQTRQLQARLQALSQS